MICSSLPGLVGAAVSATGPSVDHYGVSDVDLRGRCNPVFVPADDKKNARLIVSQIVLDAFDELEMAYPKTTAKRRQELKSIRKAL